MDLDGVLDELYGAPPERFTARRDELVRQARADGDKDLASAVHALRRPTAAAWVVNALARQAPEAVGGLVELGARMREAQSVLSGSQMRALSRERQQVLAHLVRQATALAAGPVSPSVSQEVEETLRAAVSDEDAADAVRTGCLTHGLSYSGLGPVDTSTATARHLTAVPGTVPGEESGEEVLEPAERVDPQEEERRRRHERELAEAESALRSSERAAAAAAARAGRARQRAQEAEEEVAERERAWHAAREASDRARAALESAVEQADAAEGVARSAREEVERVRSAPAGS